MQMEKTMGARYKKNETSFHRVAVYILVEKISFQLEEFWIALMIVEI